MLSLIPYNGIKHTPVIFNFFANFLWIFQIFNVIIEHSVLSIIPFKVAIRENVFKKKSWNRFKVQENGMGWSKSHAKEDKCAPEIITRER